MTLHKNLKVSPAGVIKNLQFQTIIVIFQQIKDNKLKQN